MSTFSELPRIRRLWPADQAQICDHFALLDQPARHMRFGGAVSEAFVQDYASRLLELGDPFHVFWDIDFDDFHFVLAWSHLGR